MSKLWAGIKGVLGRGEDPTVTLTPGMLVLPTQGRPGPKKAPAREPSLVELAAQPVLGDKARPRCLNPHCKKRLRSKQKNICGDYCREQALIAYRAVVDLLVDDEAPLEDVPDVTTHYARRVRFY